MRTMAVNRVDSLSGKGGCGEGEGGMLEGWMRAGVGWGRGGGVIQTEPSWEQYVNPRECGLGSEGDG